MRLTIDSFAWIEIIRGTRLGIRSQRLIDDSDSSYTPSIVLAEVAHRCLRDGMEERVVLGELDAMAEATHVVPIDPGLATGASRATRILREHARARNLAMPGLGDGLVLATARKFGAGVLTGDAHFEGLSETVWLG